MKAVEYSGCFGLPPSYCPGVADITFSTSIATAVVVASALPYTARTICFQNDVSFSSKNA